MDFEHIRRVFDCDPSWLEELSGTPEANRFLGALRLFYDQHMGEHHGKDCADVPQEDGLGVQVEGLADVLLKEFGGPVCDESACEMAIRLLRQYKRRLADVEE